MLIEGLLIIQRDPLSGLVCLGGALVLNALGFFMWSRRRHASVYPALQAYLAILSIVTAIVVLVVKVRGADDAMSGLVSTHLSYWTLVAGPAAMLVVLAFRLAETRGSESRVDRDSMSRQ
jgi:hypothetical protein